MRGCPDVRATSSLPPTVWRGHTFGPPRRPRALVAGVSSIALAVVALLALAFIGRTTYLAFYPSEGWGLDFKLLWGAGSYALEGKDPYTFLGLLPPNQDVPSFHYPPSTIPFFKFAALVSFPTAMTIWTVMNILMCLSFGLMTRRALIAQDGEKAAALTPAMAALLTAPVILSNSLNFGIEGGQTSFLVTFSLLAALIVQGRASPRPALAAAFLALASIKAQTMFPFLLLFLRRGDFRTWLYLCLFVAALTLGAGNPADLPNRIRSMLEGVAAARAPGSVDDFSLLNHFGNSIIGCERPFACLGILDHWAVAALGLACAFGLGAWLTYIITRKQILSRGACCAVVSLYSMVFVYHRLYDLSILIIPLIYSASRLYTASRPARWCYVWVMIAVLLCLNAPYGEFLRIQTLYSSSAILRIGVLPSVTYFILSAIFALVAAAALEARPSTMGAELTQQMEDDKPVGATAGLIA
jgi:hypothetical protein